jgi:hypothetical protein
MVEMLGARGEHVGRQLQTMLEHRLQRTRLATSGSARRDSDVDRVGGVVAQWHRSVPRARSRGQGKSEGKDAAPPEAHDLWLARMTFGMAIRRGLTLRPRLREQRALLAQVSKA